MNIEVRFLRARVEGERHHCHETILRNVQKAPGDIFWEIDRKEFDKLMATKKRTPSRFGWDSISSLQVCWRGWAPNSFCGPVPAQLAASSTVFIPKSSAVDNNGRVSVDTMYPSTGNLCSRFFWRG